MKSKLFWKYFKDIFRFDAIGQYEPNPGHQFLKELENMGKEVTVITQNVDGLHRKAGSTNVLEVHGEFIKEIGNDVDSDIENRRVDWRDG
ncbi:Sir2 family NAD-dependent protein deacetylase [Paenibacillus alkaliterrae]